MDRRGPGEETSYGNAGLIERASVIPYAFPRDLRSLLRYALNNRPDVRYHPRFLPRVAPWLARYWWHSAPSRLARAARAMLPLIERSVAEHDALKDEAGIAGLFHRTGWIDGARSQAGLDQAAAEAASLSSYGEASGAGPPGADGAGAGPVRAHGRWGPWLDPVNVSDPGAVTRGYAALLQRRGGVFVNGDARSLRQDGGGWRVDTADGPLRAREAVVALGPWSTDVLRPLGYRVPMAVKRGYHQHFALERGAALTRPVADIDNGFVMTPMTLGLRLTTGAEFASRDAPPTPVQIGRVRALAGQLVPLGAAVEASPGWVAGPACRTCVR